MCAKRVGGFFSCSVTNCRTENKKEFKRRTHAESNVPTLSELSRLSIFLGIRSWDASSWGFGWHHGSRLGKVAGYLAGLQQTQDICPFSPNQFSAVQTVRNCSQRKNCSQKGAEYLRSGTCESQFSNTFACSVSPNFRTNLNFVFALLTQHSAMGDKNLEKIESKMPKCKKISRVFS